MIDFIKLVDNILKEQGKTKKALFENKIVSENTFFKYRQRYPSLRTAIKIANFLQVSLDYLFEFSNENHFKIYKKEELKFYENLISFIKNKKISARQFCKDMGYSKDNINRWKNGISPTIPRLLEIGKYFACTIDDLLL